MKERYLEKVKLLEIRKQDGAQKYIGESGEIYWLTGIDRISNVKINDEGAMYYVSTPTKGYFKFIKENK